LFNIYLKDIVNHLHPKSKILLYADNIVIYFTDKNIHHAYKSVQLSLDSITNYLRFRELDLSPEKSKWMVFTRARILPPLPSLKILGSSVPGAYAVKFLGIVLDAGLSSKDHFRYIIHKGSILVDILILLTGIWLGSHPHLLINLYRSIFRGSIEYGCQIFKFYRNKTIFTKLQRLQFCIIRIAISIGISNFFPYQCHAL